MAQHLRDDEPTMMYQCAFGLIGLPETVRSKAVAAMEKLVLDPDFPVSSWFLITLPVLHVLPSSMKENSRQEPTIDRFTDFMKDLSSAAARTFGNSQYEVRYGDDVAKTILTQADADAADLIVLGVNRAFGVSFARHYLSYHRGGEMPGPDRQFMSQEATPNQLAREAEISEAKKYSRTRPYHGNVRSGALSSVYQSKPHRL
jgi:hypothetical protein